MHTQMLSFNGCFLKLVSCSFRGNLLEQVALKWGEYQSEWVLQGSLSHPSFSSEQTNRWLSHLFRVLGWMSQRSLDLSPAKGIENESKSVSEPVILNRVFLLPDTSLDPMNFRPVSALRPLWACPRVPSHTHFDLALVVCACYFFLLLDCYLP